MNKSIKISGLLSALLLACGGVQAAGLGKLSVQSALGQPLRAEIELLSVTKDELPGVSARVAGHELFRQARIERSGVLGALEFEVAQRANGQPVLRISSSTPMSDPFLDMLIELNWSTGRVIREYTILLDPPAEGRATPQPAAAKTVAPASPAKEGAAAETPKPVQEAAKPAAKPAPERYGPVKSGETLRSIAGRVKNPDVTLEQMMAGLYLANKGAFIDSNMNLLKKGTVLNVPSAEVAHRQNSPSQATRMVRNHLDEWHAYRSKVAQVAGEVPETKPEGQAAAGKIMPKVEDKTPAPAAPKDVLKLSKGEPAAAGKPDAKTQERLQALEEELAAKTRALQESSDRVSQLEQAVKDMQKLLALKSQEAAKPEAVPAPAPTAVEPAQPAAPEPAPVQAAKPAPAPVSSLPPAAKEEEESWFTTFLKNPIYIGGLVAAGLLSGLLWMMMVGSRRRQGLNKFEDSIMTGGEFKSGAVFNAEGAAATAGATANTGGSMLLTDFSRLGLGAIDTHEVDPIAEAEVYMAYGRDAQAEEILKEALEKDSSRHEVSLKLLEIYAARKDPLAFETTASELYAGLGGQDTPIWQRAAEMGRSIDAENPLYRMAHGTAFAGEPSVSEAPQAGAEEAVPEDLGMEFVSPLAEETAAKVQADRGMDLEFTSSIPEPEYQAAAPEAPLEFETAPALAMEGAQPVDELSMEFEPVATDLAQAEVPELAIDLEGMEELPLEEEVPEFRIETEAPESQLEEFAPPTESIALELPAAEAEAATLPDLDFSSIDLELAPEAPVHEQAEAVAEIEFEPQVQVPAETETIAAPAAEQAPDSGIDPTLWEEVNTKLDLARAYLEMGDREGAREILQEVTQEGDRTQKAEANKLLAEAG